MRRRSLPLHMVFTIVTLTALLPAATGCSVDPSFPGGRYAFLYGSSDYDGYYLSSPGVAVIRNLDYSDDDAAAMAALLESQGWTTRLRLDGTDEELGAEGVLPATRSRMEEDIAWAAANLGPDDTLLLYVSSHGGRPVDIFGDEAAIGLETDDLEDEWLFLYSDSFDIGDYESGWPENAVSDDAMGEWLSLIEARKVLIADSCHSGGFIGTQAVLEEDASLNGAIRIFLEFPAEQEVDVPASTAFVLAAAGELEFSVETSALGHGIFTYYLMESGGYYEAGILPGDRNGDGLVTLLESYAYVREAIETNFPRSGFLPRISGSSTDIVLFSSL